MIRIDVIALLGVLALAGCGQEQLPAPVVPTAAQDLQPNDEGDPFYAHSFSRRSQASTPQADTTDVVKPRRLDQDPEAAQIKRFAEYLASIGFRLRYDADRSEWQTVKPIVGSFVIGFKVGAFPRDSTLPDMQRSLMAINLAFGLNPDAHLAMSNPSLVRLTPSATDRRELEAALKSAAFLEAQGKLKRAFLDYRPSNQ